MNKFFYFYSILFFLLLFLSFLPLQTQSKKQYKVAVSGNFLPVMTILKSTFEKQFAYSFSIISGSSGKLTAQILNGADIDAFFSADSHYPQIITKALVLEKSARKTYAIGQLVLLASNQKAVFGLSQLQQYAFTKEKIALANPLHAPYGQAAQEVLIKLNLWKPLEKQFVFGENVVQAYHFIKTRSSDFAFVSLSQVLHNQNDDHVSIYKIPKRYHQPIKQQFILLKNNTFTEKLNEFILSEQAQMIIKQYGYGSILN